MKNQIQQIWVCEHKKRALAESLFSEVVPAERTGQYAIWNAARDTGSLGSQQAGMTGGSTQDTCACSQSQIHTHVHTPSVIKKNTITNTVELITFLAISYMSTHAEHLCPPPLIVLLCLILFSAEMIMISLAAKYECKFINLVPAKTHSVYWSVIIVHRQTGKEHF